MKPLSENAIKVLEKRYLIKDSKGIVTENPTDLFWRVARTVAKAEEGYAKEAHVSGFKSILMKCNVEANGWAQKFYNIMSNLDFLPNSPTLMNAGRPLGQLSACFVLPVGDSMSEIFDAVKNTALIHKSGGGTGFNFSSLRPKNDVVQTTSGVSSGPISFMTVFDAATEVIKQGGKRRGANMALLRVDHPDILDFIVCKSSMDKLQNFNISVGITDEFMKARNEKREYNLVSPRTGEIVGQLKAEVVWDFICKEAWRTGDPGVIFLDTVNHYNQTKWLGEMDATNPCEEQPLYPYESCNLGSINLSNFISYTGISNTPHINHTKLEEVTAIAVRFLDNVIDINKYPIEQIKEATLRTRKIGLGVMGFADMLVKLGVPYRSNGTLGIAKEVMSAIRNVAMKTSEQLAEERGTYPAYEPDGRVAPRRRNATVTTIAPTGSISIIAGCSSGIEPYFALAYRRNILDGESLVEFNPIFKKYVLECDYIDAMAKKELLELAGKNGDITGSNIKGTISDLFVTANDIPYDWHIKVQAEFQRHVCNAVSKTINMPITATVDHIDKAYRLAYKNGCKGITVFRDGSRDAQVFDKGIKVKAIMKAEEGTIQPEVDVVPRPQKLEGTTLRMQTSCGWLYVTVNFKDGKLFEVFTRIGKAGGCASSQNEAIGRLVSASLRAGVSPSHIIKQLVGITCHLPNGFGDKKVLSCADALGKALGVILKGQPQTNDNTPREEGIYRSITISMRGACPECGGPIESAGSCNSCRQCGYSEC